MSKHQRKKFHGLYWRQLFVAAGMVLLTLTLLGASFFALSYNYARNQKTEEIRSRAQVMSQLSISYLENGRFLSIEKLQSDPAFRQLATFAATVSDMQFMICDTAGHVLLSTDANLSGRVMQMPQEMTDEVMATGVTARYSTLGNLYENHQFVVGVAAVNPSSQEIVGEVFGVATTASLDAMWNGFVGLFVMTAMVVLMVSFIVASIATERQTQPIREMVRATQRYAEGEFDIRMRAYDRDDEIGELATSFNNMAESLQQTERQRQSPILIMLTQETLTSMLRMEIVALRFTAMFCTKALMARMRNLTLIV